MPLLDGGEGLLSAQERSLNRLENLCRDWPLTAISGRSISPLNHLCPADLRASFLGITDRPGAARPSQA